MHLNVHKDRTVNGISAAKAGAEAIRKAIAEQGHANVIVATGASQFEMLQQLVQEPGIPWNKVTCFHLDEYVGMPITHGASFRKYLWERFVSKLPLPLKAFHYVEADAADPQAECRRLGELIKAAPIEVAFVGIGENAHLAFNDPPADFDTNEPFIVVTLDEACRKQQFGEGWFPTMNDVPTTAISMSCRQIMKAKTIIVTCPDARKADAVQKTIESAVTNTVPATILQRHEDCRLFIDEAAASKLKR